MLFVSAPSSPCRAPAALQGHPGESGRITGHVTLGGCMSRLVQLLLAQWARGGRPPKVAYGEEIMGAEQSQASTQPCLINPAPGVLSLCGTQEALAPAGWDAPGGDSGLLPGCDRKLKIKAKQPSIRRFLGVW